MHLKPISPMHSSTLPPQLQSMFKASTVPLTRADVLLLKYIISASMYPRVAIADRNNKQRRNQDCRCLAGGGRGPLKERVA